MTKLEFDLYNKAIISLFPRKPKFALRNKEIISWSDEEYEQPTEEQIQAKLSELQAEYEANQYQRDRASQYPSITDVVVALAEKEEGNDAMWQEITAQRAKVKADNPKPE